MAGSVILAGARTPIGKLSGAWPASGRRPRRLRHQGRARAGRRRPRPGRLRLHGPGAPGRRRPDHRPPGRRQRRHPDDRAATTVNKVCLSGLNAIYLADLMIQAGRGRHRRRRRHGVDDPGALPAARCPRRLPPRRPARRRLDDVRRPVLRLRPGGAWAPAPRSTPPPPASPASPGRPCRQVPRACRPRHQGRACSTTRSSRSRSRSARATRSWSTPTRACGPAPPSSRSAASARRSTRPATSPPATPRRSPTAAPRRRRCQG